MIFCFKHLEDYRSKVTCNPINEAGHARYTFIILVTGLDNDRVRNIIMKVGLTGPNPLEGFSVPISKSLV